ncbi:4-diphosphocytidyl-2-C-methyl-D-erythritol kinase [Amylibacter ulvae]|uniref:4-diphosphocytidyl-2-C-methyl-D-erythritol kinase n=1 Tax=Paramylibacter ulvae TaxID=1651968 RepID=A0ABQ3D381_9RHOB|nr:4-(cytidine 5'-diphospho)-2-C-methyl-D-erythritol kinase [Amylibacter ulvae]GHA56474.1 4-diphosphocytidyl-2-C-methyl-D-erythritol kinase [Amylibacter ulvae]
MEIKARAKVNLCLHVVGQREDGYHLLDSLVVFADIGDDISVEPDNKFLLEIDGPFAAGLSNGSDNLVLRAAKMYENTCNGAAIRLTKTLPISSGIGGGSADAAAVLRAISDMSGAPIPADNGLSLGADVPVCLMGSACRMRGIGGELTPLHNIPTLNAVLVNPNVSVSTPEIFRALDCKTNPNIGDFDGTNFLEELKNTRNDLQKTAIQIEPIIADCLASLMQSDANFVRMSGSGATCFGLFDSASNASHAAKIIKKDHPEWWVAPCVLNGA